MRRCRSIQAALPAFVAGELQTAAEQPLRQHLQRCPPCRQQASAHLQARRALCAGAVLPELDDGFFAELHGAVMQRIAAQPAPKAAPVPGRRLRAAGAAAAAAMFLLGVWFVPRPGHPLLERQGLSGPAPASLRWQAPPSLRPVGFDAIERYDDRAPFAQGMLGRDLLPQLVEVDLLGMSTLSLEVLRPAAPRPAEPSTASGGPR